MHRNPPNDSTSLYTLSMVTVGQSPWDDIKLLGLGLGHLISNSEPGGTPHVTLLQLLLQS